MLLIHNYILYYIRKIKYCMVKDIDLSMNAMNAERMSNEMFCSQDADDIDSATLISLGSFEM
jgi:hypothetical protein